MTSQPTYERVTASELFTLADQISDLSGKAALAMQPTVAANLNETLTLVLDSAKSAAFNEAHAAHNEKTAKVAAAPPETHAEVKCNIPANGGSLGHAGCDLPWGHPEDLHANAGDGFYSPTHEAEHHRRQKELK